MNGSVRFIKKDSQNLNYINSCVSFYKKVEDV